ncbi:hypothetical protein FOL47_009964 [Perkinsus chesapeaki]|uniref:Amidase domain-containing protein n=1 Tax=Perkinsus chesapeaki TaxID=330153 RepID=A0A7J6L5J6_PERCH|nr:hypothetical protein FOL47_009964 [Perkinsus chesapeaki]
MRIVLAPLIILVVDSAAAGNKVLKEAVATAAGGAGMGVESAQDAMAESMKNYDLKAMELTPMEGKALDIAGRAVTGNWGHTFARKAAALRSFSQIGVSGLEKFAKGLKNGGMKWPIYQIGEDRRSEMVESAKGPSPSKDGLSGADPSKSYQSIEDYHAAYKERSLSPIDVAEVVYNRMKELNETFHFMREYADYNEIIRAAQASHDRFRAGNPLSLLDGIPFIVKDEMSAQGFVELLGTNPYNPKNPRLRIFAARNDPVIQALLDAGAILFGTSVMHEYGISPVGYNIWHQGPKNAFNREYFTGGSSSGSATGVALGLFLFAIGFDGGGSVRIPSSWSGVVGYISTFGTVRYENSETEIFTTIHCGPITANVADAAIVMSVIAKTQHTGTHFYDQLYLDKFGAVMPPLTFSALYEEQDYTIGYDPAWVHDSEPAVYQLFDEVATWLRSQEGITIDGNFVMTNWKQQALAHTLTIASEFAVAHRNDNLDILEPNTKLSLALGKEVKPRTIAAAEKVKQWASEQWMEQFEKMDVVITPAMAMPAQPIKEGIDTYGFFDGTLVSKMLKYIWPSNLLGFPSVVVTLKNEEESGLPIGIQVICRPFEDDKCLAVAKKIEEKYSGTRSHPKEWTGDLSNIKEGWVDVMKEAFAWKDNRDGIQQSAPVGQNEGAVEA